TAEAYLADGTFSRDELLAVAADQWEDGDKHLAEASESFKNPVTSPRVEGNAAEAKLPALVSPAPPPLAPNYDDALEAMNERHAIIDNVGSKSVIASWEPSSRDQSRQEVIFQNKESFLLRYSNRTISTELPDGQGGTTKVSMGLGHWWLNHRHRRQYRGILFLLEKNSSPLKTWQSRLQS